MGDEMSGHTPGPWVHGIMGTSNADTTVCYVRSEKSDPVETLIGEPDICICQEEANARLIAAAPEMSATLTKFVRAVEAERPDIVGKDEDYVYDELRALGMAYLDAKAAIAKATQP